MTEVCGVSVYEHVPTQTCASTPACVMRAYPPEVVDVSDIFLDKFLAAPELGDAGGGLQKKKVLFIGTQFSNLSTAVGTYQKCT